MTFNAYIQADTLDRFLDIARALVEEAKVHVAADGLHLNAVDPANVGMVKIDLDADAFESYTAEEATLGLNLNRLADVVSMADSGDMVELALNTETRKLQVTIAGSLDYTLALIDPDSIRQEPDVPDLDLPATIRCEGGQFDRGLTAADIVGDHVTLAADAEAREFVMDAQGDTDDVEVTYDGQDLIDAKVDESARSMFSLDYMADIAGPLTKGTEITLEIGDGMPMRMAYEFAEGRGQVVNNVAPRVDTGGR